MKADRSLGAGPHSIKPGYAALRGGRVSIPGQAYILTWVTHHRRPALSPMPAARTVIRCLMHADRRNWTETFAFVVMPDHVHWCVRLGEGKSLSDIVRSVKHFSARKAIERGLTGSRLWQSGYHDRALRSGDDLVAVSRYVVRNPLRAGLVDHIGDYPHWDAIWMQAFISPVGQ